MRKRKKPALRIDIIQRESNNTEVKINYITNLSLQEVSGGWSGINFRLHQELSQHFQINYVGSVNPPVFFIEKAISKGRRLLGMRGAYHFFSDKRLQSIKFMVEEKLEDAGYSFFFGQMPWLQCTSKAPYGVYMDACFSTYLEVFVGANAFLPSDVQRIEALEREWLSGARDIFWGSQWALDETLKRYAIDERVAHHVVHVGGNIPVPDADRYSGELLFVFISLNFEKKGGYVCFKAFQAIRQKHPRAQLTIIGQQPPQEVLQQEGVNYAGLLDKSNPTDLRRFQEILESAFFLIHPTTMDTMGAVIIEAGYYGCPAIAPRSFGIPELIQHEVTGIVVDVPFSHQIYVDVLLQLINEPERYKRMRKAARDFTVGTLTWRNIGLQIVSSIREGIK